MRPETTRRRVSSNAICTRPSLSGRTERTVANASSAGASPAVAIPGSAVFQAPLNRAPKKPSAISASAPTGAGTRMLPNTLPIISRNCAHGPPARGICGAPDRGHQIATAIRQQVGRQLGRALVERRRQRALPLELPRAGRALMQVLLQAFFLFGVQLAVKIQWNQLRNRIATHTQPSRIKQNLPAPNASSAWRETGSSWRPPRWFPAFPRWCAAASPGNAAIRTPPAPVASGPPARARSAASTRGSTCCARDRPPALPPRRSPAGPPALPTFLQPRALPSAPSACGAGPGRCWSQCGRARYENCNRTGTCGGCGTREERPPDRRHVHPPETAAGSWRAGAHSDRRAAPVARKRPDRRPALPESADLPVHSRGRLPLRLPPPYPMLLYRYLTPKPPA